MAIDFARYKTTIPLDDNMVHIMDVSTSQLDWLRSIILDSEFTSKISKSDIALLQLVLSEKTYTTETRNEILNIRDRWIRYDERKRVIAEFNIKKDRFLDNTDEFNLDDLLM